LPAAKDPED
jgi:fibronectin type 3 domain-containing protein